MKAGASSFQFGVFDLDLRARELRKNGIRIRLQDQPLCILALLLEGGGAVVTREQIKNSLWPDKTFVDFESSINGAVRKLRDALSDSAENPRFVATIARQGYRFVAPVTPVFQPEEPTVELPEVKDKIRSTPTGTVRRRWLFAGAAALLVGTLLTVGWFASRHKRSAPSFEVVPLTSYRGSERRPSFSPDGTRVAFSWDGLNSGDRAIYAKTLDAGDPVRLTQDASHCDNDPAWSPDGRNIAFLRCLSSGGKAIMIVPCMGGTEREARRAEAAGFGALPHLSWSADSRYLFWSEWDRKKKGSPAIIRNDIQTGLTHQITFPGVEVAFPEIGPVGDTGGTVSPDGSHLAFARGASLTRSDIYTVQLSKDYLPDRLPEKILSGVETESLAWTADGRQLVFTGRVGHTNGIWRVEVTGNHAVEQINGIPQAVAPPEPIFLETDRRTDLAISRQGGYLVYTQANFDNNIWRAPLIGPNRNHASRLISSTRNEFQPDFSPDGRFIAFESDRSGSEEIWMANANGTGTVQLTSFGNGLSSIPRWAPDSRRIAFEYFDSDNRVIHVIDSRTRQAVAVTSQSNDNFAPTWSADGRFVYFTSKRTGRFETWRVPSRGGREEQVTRNGSIFAQESMNGRSLYYGRYSRHEFPVFRSDLDGSSEAKIIDTQAAFVIARHGIYFYRPSESDVTLEYLDFSTRAVRVIAPMPTSVKDQVGRITISADERWVAYGHEDFSATDLMLVKNFR